MSRVVIGAAWRGIAVLALTLAGAGQAAEVRTPAAGASGRIDAIRQRGTLRVAVLDEYPWLVRTEGAGAPFRGPAWVLAEEYARRLGVRIETVAVDFDSKTAVLAEDRADITVAPLLMTPARLAALDMVRYSMSAQCLFGRADNPKLAGRGIDALNRADVRIAFITGSPRGAWLQRRLSKAAPRGVPGNLADVPVDEVVSGRADVSTIDKYFFAALAARTPGLVSVPGGAACLASRELPIPIGMAVAKGQPVFAEWLRAVAAAVRGRVRAEQRRVESQGAACT